MPLTAHRVLRLLLCSIMAFAAAWSAVILCDHLTAGNGPDAPMIGQTVGTALFPALIVIGFGWRSGWGAPLLLTLLAGLLFLLGHLI